MAVAHVATVRTIDHTGIGTDVTSAAFTPGAAGAMLICGVWVFDGGAGNPTVSAVSLDAGAQAFTQDLTRANASGDSRLYIFSLPNVAASSHTVRVTRSGANVNLEFYVMEVSGAATASPQDGAGASATASTANAASGNFTASVTDGFWFAMFGNENTAGDGTIAAGSGWTIPANGSMTAAENGGCSAVEYRANPGSAGAFNGNFTSAASAYGAGQFVYKASGGAAETITIDKWLGNQAVVHRRRIGVVPSGTIGIKA